MKQLLHILQRAVKGQLLVFGLLFCSASLLAQQVSGTIKSESDEPLVGASVLVKGTSNGAITDENGAFKLNNVPKASTLVVSFVGFESLELTADGAAMSIVLKTSAALDEVVVTGTFDPRTRFQTSSAFSILKTKDIERVAATSAGDYLKNIAGVFVNAGRGEIGNQVATRGLSVYPQLQGYQYISMQEDGLPITSLNYGTDYYLRPDATTNRIEVLRGGAAAVTAVFSTIFQRRAAKLSRVKCAQKWAWKATAETRIIAAISTLAAH